MQRLKALGCARVSVCLTQPVHFVAPHGEDDPPEAADRMIHGVATIWLRRPTTVSSLCVELVGRAEVFGESASCASLAH